MPIRHVLQPWNQGGSRCIIGPVDATTAPVIGRESELADIAARLNPDALPAVVLVEGEAGIGKSSMCTLAIGAARERGFTTPSLAP